MNRDDLIEKVAKSSGFSKKDAEKAVASVLDSIFDALKQGEDVQLNGFGNFDVRDREARIGRSRKTGQEIELPAGKIPVFSAGKALKEALN
ncbi:MULTISPECIES: HU family DNA-binding protein [unclassified Paenibacillus]|uniref:HU family DNA-binding protein n=1 Tax=unclassified Paenibacillus TaxID=185978 RepID=UPI001AE64ADD|nr:MULTISPECIES: HU family DNA-binding protein [unclassified Paenibacillus]MBP1156486.1 DNA-binding protein HU-beta [Paenibacillus sp. PvP091]MBP1168128.1 DNA-binding protein HU-beta [Paenibacillus sp. PvR098]MBP2439156.1 DNA-binding protein HU-beta [Paenibacillus sp. PvP052]